MIMAMKIVLALLATMVASLTACGGSKSPSASSTSSMPTCASLVGKPVTTNPGCGTDGYSDYTLCPDGTTKVWWASDGKTNLYGAIGSEWASAPDPDDEWTLPACPK